MGRGLIVALSAAAVLLVGCGGGSKKKAPPVVNVKGVDFAFVMPDTVPGGVSTFKVSNAGKKIHEYAFGRLTGGHTLEQLKAVLDKGQEPPSWAEDLAGVPVLSPGQQVSITRRLRPGNYVFICFVPEPFPNGKPHYQLGMIKQFRIAGNSGAKLPKADAVVTAREKSMDVPALKAGRQTIELRNAASKPREFELLSLKPGKSVQEAGAWFQNPKGPSPVVLLGALQSIPAGTSVFLDVTLKAGRTYRFSDEENKLAKIFKVS